MSSIHEVSKKTGLTDHTLRYYEKVGILVDISRTQGGVRQYSDADLESLNLICCLKNTGMPLQEISRFLELTRKGDRTMKERVELLRAHREIVRDQMKETKKYLDKVTQKLDIFSEKLREYEER